MIMIFESSEDKRVNMPIYQVYLYLPKLSHCQRNISQFIQFQKWRNSWHRNPTQEHYQASSQKKEKYKESKHLWLLQDEAQQKTGSTCELR